MTSRWFLIPHWCLRSLESQDRSLIVIVTALQVAWLGNYCPAPSRDRYFFISTVSMPKDHLPSWPVGIGVNQPGHKTDLSSPSATEGRNLWSYTSAFPYVILAWFLSTGIPLPHIWFEYVASLLYHYFSPCFIYQKYLVMYLGAYFVYQFVSVVVSGCIETAFCVYTR